MVRKGSRVQVPVSAPSDLTIECEGTAEKWPEELALVKKQELIDLYIIRNLTIFEVATHLNISYQTVHKRLKRFSIPTVRHLKTKYNNQNLFIKPHLSAFLAEFFGVMYGDGHVADRQAIITVDITDEGNYLAYLCNLTGRSLGLTPSIGKQRGKVRDIIISNAQLMRHLNDLGLTSQNKTKVSPVIPEWILADISYRQSFIRGFFDTDGCIYKTRSGLQLSFTNRATRLLEEVRSILTIEGFSPSKISHDKVYLTRRNDIVRYFSIIGSSNIKHLNRYNMFAISSRVTQVVNEG